MKTEQSKEPALGLLHGIGKRDSTEIAIQQDADRANAGVWRASSRSLTTFAPCLRPQLDRVAKPLCKS